MSLTLPKFITKRFAASGQKNDIPIDSVSSSDGLAAYDVGFPAVTMVPKMAGGKPPRGRDFNGILYDLSSGMQYSQVGMHYPFNQAFCDAIGGYPKGSIILGRDGVTLWQSTIDSNTTDPDSAGASGWAKVIDIATEQDIQDRTPGKLVDAAGLSYARFPTTKIFESSGSFTVPAGVTKVRVRVVGGGGGSAGGNASAGGAGGSGGGYSEGVFDVSAGEVYAVTVGSGGAGGVNNGGVGKTGGASSFGNLISATGGGGAGTSSNPNFPSEAGQGSGGYINISGMTGMSGSLGASGAYANVYGGSSHLGGQTRAYNEKPRAATEWGAGGAAKGSIGVSSGAAGAPGVVIVEW